MPSFPNPLDLAFLPFSTPIPLDLELLPYHNGSTLISFSTGTHALRPHHIMLDVILTYSVRSCLLPYSARPYPPSLLSSTLSSFPTQLDLVLLPYSARPCPTQLDLPVCLLPYSARPSPFPNQLDLIFPCSARPCPHSQLDLAMFRHSASCCPHSQ
jgi:hypothetical protein